MTVLDNLGSGTVNAILMTWGVHCPTMVGHFITADCRKTQLQNLINRYDALPPVDKNKVLLKYTKSLFKSGENKMTALIYPEIKRWSSDTKLLKDMVMAIELEKRNV